VILWRVLPWRPEAAPRDPRGALWFARELQGAGRHDNPELYGCLYAAERAVSAVAEALAPFRGTGKLMEGMLTRSGLPLALAQLSLSDDARILDLDDPAVLQEVGLRPSQVATGERTVTQGYAARLYALSTAPSALRWWSTIEASFANLTVFERVGDAIETVDVSLLTRAAVPVLEAAELLGLIG
jgi:RES domain-containing protein